MNDVFAGAIADIAAALPAGHIDAWASVLGSLRAPGPATEGALIDARPGYAVASQARSLLDVWLTHAPDLPGPGVALALRAAARVQERANAHRAQLVVSGPSDPSIPVRLTSSVVTELIRSARRSLLIVSFAAYGIREVIEELAAAAARGVTIDLVLEVAAEDGGTLRSGLGAPKAFAALRQQARFWYWPSQRRPIIGPTRAALHAKILAADTRSALISSANLTDRALSSNLEIGVVLHDPHLVERLVQHFATLMSPQVAELTRITKT